MKQILALTLSLLFVVLSGCSGSNDNNSILSDLGNINSNSENQDQEDNEDDEEEEPRPALELNFTMAPIELPGISAKFAENIRYGEAERNLFDIYLPECDDPTPLVIYIHGGGFTGGDKSSGHNRSAQIQELLQACVAYATINYTLLNVPSAAEGTASIPGQGGVLTSLQDAARALQFLRYHFASLNLDPEQVAAIGGSAGAGASLWLGTHDDMADPGNEDPVLRESTRLKAVGALATQSTYDLIVWEQALGPLIKTFEAILGGTDLPTVAATVGATNYMLTFLGVETVAEIYEAENVAYRANVDMLGLMDAGDAPIYVHNYTTGIDNLLNMFLHHGLHAIAVKDRADEVGLESAGYSEQAGYIVEDPSGEGLNSFIMRHIL